MHHNISDEHMAIFLKLASGLSPENLAMDGEATTAQINAKYKNLTKQWHDLEDELQTHVTEAEVYQWHSNKRKY